MFQFLKGNASLEAESFLLHSLEAKESGMMGVLNRLKSEFDLARLLYFESINPKEMVLPDVLYTNLASDEYIGIHSEKLRASFRMGYGILDKIAIGICNWYDLPLNIKKITFESFWKKEKGEDKSWIKLNQVANRHLCALYSIATELNTTNGEWAVFKNWRNKLEHSIFIIQNSETEIKDPSSVYSDEKLTTVVQLVNFQSKTLHLLQLVKSAIFSFTYCIRQEAIQEV